MNTRDHSEDNVHSLGILPLASPADATSSNTASWTSSSTITACDRWEATIPISAKQMNRRRVKTKKKTRHLSPSSTRPSPERSILKKKSGPTPPPLDSRDSLRLSSSQLPENAIEDDVGEDLLPPASLISVLPVKSKPGSRGLASGNPPHFKNQRAPTQFSNRLSNPKHKHPQLTLDEAGFQNGSNGKPGSTSTSNIRPTSQQTLRTQLVEYDANVPPLRAVGFEYSPKRFLSNPKVRSSAFTRSPAIITNEVPKPLCELAPGWREQPREATPSPAESDMRRAAQGHAGQFGEIFITPFRGFPLQEMGPLPADLDRRPLAEGWTWPQGPDRSRSAANRCPGPRQQRGPGLAMATRTQQGQQPHSTRDLPSLPTATAHGSSERVASMIDLPTKQPRLGRSTADYCQPAARSSTNHRSGSLSRSAERSPIISLESIPEVQFVMRPSLKKVTWVDELQPTQDREREEHVQENQSKQTGTRKDPGSSSDKSTGKASKRPSRPFVIDRSGRRPSGGLVAKSIVQVQTAEHIGATFAPLPSADTILRPVASATSAAATPTSTSIEPPSTTTASSSPTFENINPLPALRRAISDLMPSRPTHPYHPLLDNYAPEQPFHIQWRRGSVDGQPLPVPACMASPPIRPRRGSASTLPLSPEPTTMASPPVGSSSGHTCTNDTRAIGWLSQQP